MFARSCKRGIEQQTVWSVYSVRLTLTYPTSNCGLLYSCTQRLQTWDQLCRVVICPQRYCMTT